MREVAKFCIDDKFTITGKGIIFTGQIIKGAINIGNYIEFGINGSFIRRRINGIEFIRHSIQNEGVFDKKNTGILIECINDEDI